MARRAPRREGDQVEADGKAGQVGASRGEGFGRAAQTRALTPRDRVDGGGQIRAALDLDDGDHIAFLRQNIDLALRRAQAKNPRFDSP